MSLANFKRWRLALVATSLLAINILTLYSPSVSAAAPGDTDAWQTANPLPAIRSASASVALNGYAYEIGGYQRTDEDLSTSTVFYAHLNSDGSVGSWNATTPLPDNRHALVATTANGYIYAIGGFNSPFEDVVETTVYYAHQNSDGTVGDWMTAANSVPQFFTAPTVATLNNYVYIMGGQNPQDGSGIPSAVSTVYYAHLNSDGTVGTWATANNLPAVNAGAVSAVDNGNIYLFGGSDLASADTREVYYAHQNSNGSLSAWNTASNALPDNRVLSTAVVKDDYVYIFNGFGNIFDNTLIHDNGISAHLNSDGTVGTWSTTSHTTPAQLAAATSVQYNGYMYIIGGVAGADQIYQDAVYYAKLGNSSLAAPTGLSATTPTKNKPALTWNTVSGATSYKVYRNGTQVGSSASASFTDSTLSNDGNYSYTVTALNSGGESAASNPLTVVYDATAPTATTPAMSGGVNLPLLGLVFLGNTSGISTTVADNLSGVNSAEYFFDSDPGQGHGTSLAISGSTATATANLSGLGLGQHTLYVRAHDAAGNWSTPSSRTFNRL